MLLMYNGSLIADRGAAMFMPQRFGLRNSAGILYGYDVTWECPSLSLAVTPETATAKILAIEAVLRNQEGDLLFLYPNGAPSGKGVLSSQTLSGVRCVAGPNWSGTRGAQHYTWIEYSCAFNWRESHPSLLVDPTNFLLDFEESVSVAGGTPLNVLIEPVNAPPIVQTTIPQQGWRITQQGTMTGVARYPAPPPPLWGPSYRVSAMVNRVSPKRIGRYFEGFTVQWAYQFVIGGSLAPTALPNAWIGYPSLPQPPVVP